MNKYHVKTTGQALAYITDCNLATVASLALKKSSPKNECSRQIAIAQMAIDWMIAFKEEFSNTRAETVVKEFDGSVQKFFDYYRGESNQSSTHLAETETQDKNSMDASLPESAYGLRPVKHKKDSDDLTHYTAITFPSEPKSGCELYMRRCKSIGGIAKSKADTVGLCDILDKDGDIVSDFPLNQKGLNYLISSLNLKIEE